MNGLYCIINTAQLWGVASVDLFFKLRFLYWHRIPVPQKSQETPEPVYVSSNPDSATYLICDFEQTTYFSVLPSHLCKMGTVIIPRAGSANFF